eukprot:GHVT01024855.1.p1 GENE.GHVT01024855.1~~GHVT01024855.1.p1  ORF type:complete len:220 (-),score=49.42 GHVT01024855.1:1942-2601(-)
MVFMKGNKNAPFCKFSKKAVAILSEIGVDYGAFDILTDEAVRQGMKKFSSWPTFPQLYVQGEFVGGVDIMEEMHASGELKAAMPVSCLAGHGKATAGQELLEAKLRRLTREKPVMLFMKGSPEAPRCKFSVRIIELLQLCGVSFGHFDILQDEEVRQGLKTFSDWPTFPQLYAHGALVGGLDVVEELIATGGPQGLKDEIEQVQRNEQKKQKPTTTTTA